MLGERHYSTSSHVRGDPSTREAESITSPADRRRLRAVVVGTPLLGAGAHEADPDEPSGPVATLLAGPIAVVAEAFADAVDRPAGVAPARPDRRRRSSAPSRSSKRRAARPGPRTSTPTAPSRRTPAARSMWREQRAVGRARWRRPCRRRRATVVARVIVREPAVADLQRERAGAGAVGAQARRRRRRRAGRARGGRRRGRGGRGRTSPRGRSTWSSRSGSTGRSSRPLARSSRWRPWARPRLDDDGSRVERGEVTDRRRRPSAGGAPASPGPTPHSRPTGSAWR